VSRVRCRGLVVIAWVGIESWVEGDDDDSPPKHAPDLLGVFGCVRYHRRRSFLLEVAQLQVEGCRRGRRWIPVRSLSSRAVAKQSEIASLLPSSYICT
jgi:hypothetical protein